MLQVTREAVDILKEARSQSGAPLEAGVRIRSVESEEGTRSVQLSFEKNPDPMDQTVETPDLRVFVSAELVEPLSDRVLDVTPTQTAPRLMFR